MNNRHGLSQQLGKRAHTKSFDRDRRVDYLCMRVYLFLGNFQMFGARFLVWKALKSRLLYRKAIVEEKCVVCLQQHIITHFSGSLLAFERVGCKHTIG